MVTISDVEIVNDGRRTKENIVNSINKELFRYNLTSKPKNIHMDNGWLCMTFEKENKRFKIAW